jgi:hypothetical protein
MVSIMVSMMIPIVNKGKLPHSLFASKIHTSYVPNSRHIENKYSLGLEGTILQARVKKSG